LILWFDADGGSRGYRMDEEGGCGGSRGEMR